MAEETRRSFAERLLLIDRRVIYVIVGLVIILPTIIPFGLPVKISYPTQMVFDAIEKIPEQNNVLMMSVEYDPQSAPELHPMAIAVLRHCFHRRIKVVALCLYAQNLGLAQEAIEQVIDEFNESKIHYTKLGVEERFELVIHEGRHEIELDSGIRFLKQWLGTFDR